MTRAVAWLGGLILALALCAGIALPFVEAWMMSVPPTPFRETPLPPAPDYGNPDHWAALPDRADGADWVPHGSGHIDRQARAPADVFFVYPTAAFYGKYWVAGLDNRLHRLAVDKGILPQHATPFNGIARIYAPRYRSVRMAIWWAEDRDSVEAATDLAYRDVAAAFDHFLENWNADRPIILASHSQGTLHLLRLLRERFDGKPLARQLVAAYIIGNTVALDALSPALPLCTRPDQTGCYVTWNTVLEGGSSFHWVEEKGLERIACVNPLSWRADTRPVPRAENPGSIPMAGWRVLREDIGPLTQGVVGARCGAEGILWLEREPEVSGFSAALFEDGTHYHTYDINFYWSSIRQNVEQRTRRFLEQRQAAAEAAQEPRR